MFKEHKSHIVGLVFLWCLSPMNAQEVEGTVSWSVSADSSIHVLSMVTGEHVACFKNHIDTLHEFTLNYENSATLTGRLGNLFLRDGLWIATFPGSGRVFIVDTLNRTIDRQDLTVYQGYNFNAYQFQRKDTIFSYGGYGFWIENNLMTYFSEARREWNLMSNAPFPGTVPNHNEQHERLHFYDRAHDVFYTGSDQELYAFDFLTHTWSKKGYISSDLEASVLYMYHRITDTTLLVMSNKGAWEIDFYGNKIVDKSIANKVNYNLTGALKTFNCVYSLNERTLLIPKTSDILSVGYSFEYIKTPMPGKGQSPLFISSSKRHLRNTLLAIAFVLMGIMFLVATYWSRLFGRRSKASTSVFSSMQIHMLRELLNGPLLTEDLNIILNVQEKSWEVQRRQRSIFLKELNGLGVRLFKSELVLREKSSADKRQVLYVINSSINDQLARLLP